MKVRLDAHDAAPAFRRLPPATKRRVKAGLQRLRDSPYPAPGVDIRPLSRDPSQQDTFRLRVGHWRIASHIVGDEVRVVRIFHRRHGYGFLADLD